MISTIKKLFRTTYNFVLSFTSVNPYILVFKSSPDYSDNSKALSDYLEKEPQYKKYKLYWIVEDSDYFSKHFPDSNIHFVGNSGYSSLLATYYFYKAAYVFSTHQLPYTPIRKRPGQKQIRLWHGCSYKDRDLTIRGKEVVPKFDYALVAGPLFVKTKSFFWNCPESMIIAKGYPRYDWLLEKNERALELSKLLMGDCSKIVIWMPTFRKDKYGVLTDSQNITTFPLMPDLQSWKLLDLKCHENKVKLVVKLHPLQEEYDIDWAGFHNIKLITNEEFNTFGTSLYAFLAVTDGLISDYSSVAVDYMIVDKPIAYALDDYIQYAESRGFIVENPLDYMPGYHLYDINMLCQFIVDISMGIDRYKSDRECLRPKLVAESKHYCKDIADYLKL